MCSPFHSDSDCAEGEDRFDGSGRQAKKKVTLRNAGTDIDAGKRTTRSSFMRDFVDSAIGEDDGEDDDKPVERAVLRATLLKLKCCVAILCTQALLWNDSVNSTNCWSKMRDNLRSQLHRGQLFDRF